MAEPKFSQDFKEIVGEYDDMKDITLDPAGYFLIRIDKDTKNIEVAFCKKPGEICLKVVGKRPQEIYKTVIDRGLTSLPEHLAYLGKECQKAKDALTFGKEYVQDDELIN